MVRHFWKFPFETFWTRYWAMVFCFNRTFTSQAQAIGGGLGSLINIDGSLKDDPREILYQKNRKLKVFDKKERRWKKMYPCQIPWTFTFAPRPLNYRQEAKLWLSAAHRVKHRFVWARQRIPCEEFSKIKSKANAHDYDRYSIVNFWFWK